MAGLESERTELSIDYGKFAGMGAEAVKLWCELLMQWMHTWMAYQQECTQAYMRMQQRGMEEYMHFLHSLADSGKKS